MMLAGSNLRYMSYGGRNNRGSKTSNVKDTHYNFPKHKELFTEDYYDDLHRTSEDGGSKEPRERKPDPFLGPEHDNDFEMSDSGSHRMTHTGVLSTYKKQLNLTAKDIVEADYWKQIRTVRDRLEERLEKTDHATFTKKYVERLRLGRDLDAPMAEIGEDYVDYKKYESDKNSVKEKNARGEWDDGTDPFLKNYNKMITEMANYEGESVRKKEDDAVKDVMSKMDTNNF